MVGSSTIQPHDILLTICVILLKIVVTAYACEFSNSHMLDQKETGWPVVQMFIILLTGIRHKYLLSLVNYIIILLRLNESKLLLKLATEFELTI